MIIIEQFIHLVFQLLETIFKFIAEAIKFAVTNVPNRKEGYNAEFTSQGSLLSSKYFGFCLTGRKNLSVKHSYQNALIVGGTGTGKSSIVLFPSLYSMKGSFVI